MAATLIDQTKVNTDENSETPVQDPFKDTPKEPEIPKKYQGKSQAELVKMLEDAQKFSGKQSNEIGDLRSVINDFIKTNTVNENAPVKSNEDKEETVDDVDFFVNPREAVSKAVENHPEIKRARQENLTRFQQESKARLQKAHPDYVKVMQDPKFVNWVRQSQIRQRLVVEADQMYSFEAADELLSTWKGLNSSQQSSTSTPQTPNRMQSVKNASTGAARGSGVGPTAKKLRASELRRLKREKPEVYNERQNEILLAYANGRVIRD